MLSNRLLSQAYWRGLILVLVVLLSGCVNPGFVPGVESQALRTTQEITVSSGDLKERFIGVVEMYPNRTALAVVAGNGLFLFSVQDSDLGRQVERHQDLPEFVDPARILSDVQLVNWPVSKLRELFGSRVKSGDRERSLNRGGKVIKTVSFDAEPWTQAVLVDLRHNYQIEVRKVSEERIRQ